MTTFPLRGLGLAVTALLCLGTGASAHDIKSAANTAITAAFDIVETRVTTDGGQAVFRTRLSGRAGAEAPASTGRFAGSGVFAYVWPTSLDSGDVGFEKGQGILALAVTFHPDFDDASKRARSGVNRDRWHPHWVVLGEDKACPGGLKVKDIPAGASPRLPADWPGVPLLIDSPDYPTALKDDTVEVRVPLAAIGGLASARFDGVTAGLKVDADLHAPLLCVQTVFKVASGDLSLPGRIAPSR